MALSWTQDRMGPLCRYAEDCALVMSVIARPDGRDLSVSEIPFNYNAHLDIRKLRVGYLDGAFEETRDPLAKKADEQTMEQVKALGLKLVPVKVPEWTIDTSSIGVESGVFFDDLIRSGRDKQMTNPGRANSFRTSRMIPAVEYLQSQRARSMMMAKLAEATADVDVYLVPVNSGGGGPAGGRGRGGAVPDASAAAAGRGRAGGGGGGFNRSVVGRHFSMANLACYPALNVVNGFAESGTPLNITFYARPFGEAELLALGKAYQDASGFHLKRPALAV
jgi:Asp-tRNA(Asn)/Glu-tRNA(Gln) amidotransferase A subunit family amidase